MKKNYNFEHQDWNVIVLNSNKSIDHIPITPLLGTKKKNGGKNSAICLNIHKIENNEKPPTTILHNLSLQIQQSRISKNLTQKKLANIIGLRENIIKTFENGTAINTSQTISDLHKVLNYLNIICHNKFNK